MKNEQRFDSYPVRVKICLTQRGTMTEAHEKPPVIEICDLTVERGATILRSVNWRVAAGENWAILGANGSGKTSLLSVLTGYLSPTTGEIRVLGETFGRFDWRELRKRVGLVSSSIRQMMPGYDTALQTVVSGASAMIGFWGETQAGERERALEILRQIEMFELRERQWRFLSEGERQRLLIGRALMAQPKLLVLDEPCAGLDPIARERFLQFLDRLGRQTSNGPSLVLVTHHVEEIMPSFSHVLILRGGEVAARGPAREVMTSEILSQAFASPVLLERRNGRYLLRVSTSPGLVL
jgi:iron complex transport system ATP-binding protein